ncbi:MAG: hypothetical protein ACXWR1_21520 [Bdellovibrionota bacterium]
MIRAILLCLLLILVISELSLRAFFAPPRLISFVQSDSYLGHRGPENEVVPIGRGQITYGPSGFRQLPHRGGEATAVWLGDSMVEAISISDADHFLTRLGRKTGLKQEILAAGDWGTTQEMLAFRKYGAPLHPRLVFLGFSSLTDFVNNDPAFAGRYQSSVDFLRPYIRMNSGAPEVYYLSPAYHFLREHSRLFLAIDNIRISRRLARAQPTGNGCANNPNLPPLEAYLDSDDPEWRTSVDLTALAFAGLKADAESAGGRFVAVFLPSDYDLLEKKWAGAMGAVQSCFPEKRAERREIENKFFRAARAANVDAISLTEELQRAVNSGKQIFLEDGHYNEAGHALVGDLLAKQLVEKSVFLQPRAKPAENASRH